MVKANDVIMWNKDEDGWFVYCTLEDDTVARISKSGDRKSIGVLPSYDHWAKFRPYDDGPNEPIPDDMLRFVNLLLVKMDRDYPMGRERTIELAKKMKKMDNK